MAVHSKSSRTGSTAAHASSLSSDWTFCEYYIPGQPLVNPSDPGRRGFLGFRKPRNS